MLSSIPRIALSDQTITALWPSHVRGQGGEDGIDVAAGFQAENRAAIVDEVELDIAAAARLLFEPVGLRPGACEIAAHDLGVGGQKCLADVAGKGEVGAPRRICGGSRAIWEIE